MPTLDNNSRGSNCKFVYDVSRPFSLICSRRVHSANMAIQIRKLSSNEAAQAFPKRRQMDVSEHTSALRQLQTGDSAELELRGASKYCRCQPTSWGTSRQRRSTYRMPDQSRVVRHRVPCAP